MCDPVKQPSKTKNGQCPAAAVSGFANAPGAILHIILQCLRHRKDEGGGPISIAITRGSRVTKHTVCDISKVAGNLDHVRIRQVVVRHTDRQTLLHRAVLVVVRLTNLKDQHQKVRTQNVLIITKKNFYFKQATTVKCE